MKHIHSFTVLAILSLLTLISCKTTATEKYKDINFRGEMRTFIENIASFAREKNSSFIVIPQNGQAVAWNTEDEDDPQFIDKSYLSSIDGSARESTFYTYKEKGSSFTYGPTPEAESALYTRWCNIYKNQSGHTGDKITILSVDYTGSSSENINESNRKNQEAGYIGYPSESQDVSTIPASFQNENSEDVTKLSEAKNFFDILNPGKFGSKEAYLCALQETNCDCIIIDACDSDGNFLTASEVASLKVKKNGRKRLVIAYMSIGEAEDYRYYWTKGFKKNDWLLSENSAWKGNYVVEYWNSQWQSVIYGSETSYTGKILEAGFDGVYLDIVDCYEYFEDLCGL